VCLPYNEDMAESTSPPTLPEVFVERILDYADGDAIRPVTVRIYKPVQRAPDEWGCTVEFQGLRPEGRVVRAELSGVDGVQALFGALRIAEVEIDRHKGRLSRGDCTLWEPIGPRGES
jgi:hypothetical protein